ncbi:MAG: GDP-mannose 4,6-dehydratase [Muribaculum sp.]|nr:GDP-mannose 4,6-dehydratase [Muribaculaceae bacterium]MCM1080538.1 GDP-mannose 4,6-dehydratase [Muribaculum sp.]
MKVLVTGAAGFIGFYLVDKLCKRGDTVFGIDNLCDYYPVSLKYARLEESGIDPDAIVQGHPVKSLKYDNYIFQRIDITDLSALKTLFATQQFDVVVNLAAQAGVRYSIENPYAYIQSNIVGFVNLLECAREHKPQHFVYASSSSVYGGNTKTPFAETDRVDNQVSIYAATKKSNELMANVYSKLYNLPTTGLRFFTVYGPWGRPDMAPMLFAKAILAGKPIKVFNNGNLSRDFTFVEDIVEGIVRVIDHAPAPSENGVPATVYNIGHGSPVGLMDFIRTMERALGKKAIMDFQPMQPGDVYTTFADTTRLESELGYQATTTLDEGLDAFARWYKSTYQS